MDDEFLLASLHHDDANAVREALRYGSPSTAARGIRFLAQRERRLTAGHGEIYLGQDTGIEQGAVEDLAMTS